MKEKKKRKIVKSVQETKKNVVSNLFFHEFIGNFKLKTKGTPKIFKEMMMLIDKACKPLYNFRQGQRSVTAAERSVKSQVVYFVNLNNHSKQLKIKE